MTLGLIYYAFQQLFEHHMLEAERDKATLILQTIEPIISMNAYLGMEDEIALIGVQTIAHQDVLGLRIILNGREVWSQDYDDTIEHVHATLPVTNPITKQGDGVLDISYSIDNFNLAILDVRKKLIWYLGILAIVFVLFGLISRYFLHPLSLIASKVKDYKLGTKIDFSDIRMDPETVAITDAFGRMLGNIREYTVLLERYKLSVDVSSIVSRMDVNGKLTYVNDEFCKACGYTRDELLNASCDIVRHPDTSNKVYQQMWETLKDKRVWKSSIKNRRKDGSDYYIKLTVVPILDDSDELIEYVAIQDDITKIIEQQEQISRQTTDLTTGLPNRIRLEEDSREAVAPKLAFIAIDNYHVIKDYFGYDVVNQTLKETAALLNDSIAGKDCNLYKLGAGEFVLLSDQATNVAQFSSICKEVIHIVDDHVIYLNDDSFNIRATAGMTSDAKNLLTYASLALQHAQQTKKELIIFEETDNLLLQHENNLVWTRKLKHALKEKRMALFVQPIVNSTTMEEEKFECLVRLIDTDGSVISPFHFLDVAKKSTIYHQITREVISMAFEYFSQIPEKQFSINLSVEDLQHIETLDFLRTKLDEYNIGSRLVIEIVESEGIDSFDEAVEFIYDMKSRGCKIAIDDFGTGYSNFAYLMQLNVDFIKIDGSLIRDIDSDRNSQIICSTIVDFAQQLGLTTVAEFVHNQSVLDYTKNMGIDYLQGYHLGEPKPIQELLKQ